LRRGRRPGHPHHGRGQQLLHPVLDSLPYGLHRPRDHPADLLVWVIDIL
jgi:hypothetical protein